MILLIIGIVSVILTVRRKHKQKSIAASAVSSAVSGLLFLTLVIFAASHPTYYKYNDRSILNSSINAVRQKYGDFDLGVVTDNKAGTVAYYIYTDNGPIMPDHMKHYYYMEYDEQGLVNKVYDACKPGG